MRKARVLGKIIEPKEFKRTQEYHGSVNTKSKTEELIEEIVEWADWDTPTNYSHAREKLNELISQAHKQGYEEGRASVTNEKHQCRICTFMEGVEVNNCPLDKETKDER